MAPKVRCSCGCGTMVSSETQRRHRRQKAPPTAQATAATRGKGPLAPLLSGDLRSGSRLSSRLRFNFLPTADSSAVEPDPAPMDVDTDIGGPVEEVRELSAEDNEGGREGGYDVVVGDGSDHVAERTENMTTADTTNEDADDRTLANARAALQARVWAGRTRRTAYVEDAEDVDDEHQDIADNDGDEADDSSSSDGEDSDSDIPYPPYTPREVLSELAMHRLRKEGRKLSEEDLAHLRLFALKTETHLKGSIYDKLKFAFPTTPVPSWKQCQSRASRLSGYEPQQFDCCVKSCCCFTGPHSDLDACPYCSSPRYDSYGKPRQVFLYFPIIPRLKAFLGNVEFAARMKYRGHEHVHNPTQVTDVFDSTLYRDLLKKKVVINGKEMPYCHFADPRDLALGLSTDGFAPFRRRKTTCWPIILFNYNLPPEIRFHLENILSVGVVPGPKKPVDFDSFLWPLVQELLRLEIGVHAYDALTETFFPLRAYLLLVFGDIPAISMVMRMKGHNGYRPCRMCNITGVRVPGARQTTLYVPLDRSSHPHVRAAHETPAYDPANLPLRTDHEFRSQANEVDTAENDAAAERLSKEYGIKGLPVLAALSSISFPDSFPFDFMHLIWENVVKNLMLLWTNAYKGLDAGLEDYHLHPTVWEAIGAASAQCGDTIPAVFGPRTPNVASDKTSWTAESRAMWFLYVGPVLLRRRFAKQKYYDHFVDLVKLIHRCLEFEIKTTEIATIREGFIEWVKQYEKIYYQNNPARLPTCPVTIHALLHIADGITRSGPVWTSWAFPMERYCSALQPAISSRRFPFASINRYLTDQAQLQMIRLMYDVKTELRMQDEPSEHYRGELRVPGYDSYILLPKQSEIALPVGVFDKVVAHLCTRFGVTPAVVRRALPPKFQQWSKIRLPDDGDTIRASAMPRRKSEDSRDTTYVRYELFVDRYARFRNVESDFTPRMFYGQLQHILVVPVAALPSTNQPATTLVLGVIRACHIESHHPSLDIHYYSREGVLEVVDVTTIHGLVGRIKDRDEWATVERGGAKPHTIYIDNVAQ